MSRRVGRPLGAVLALSLLLSACGSPGGSGASRHSVSSRAASSSDLGAAPSTSSSTTGAVESGPGTASGATTSASPSGTPTPTKECGEKSARKAKDAVLKTLEKGSGGDMLSYNPTYMEASTYDPCAELSAIVVVLNGNGHPPASTLLFHRGKFFKNLDEGYSTTKVRRVSDDTLTVTYHYTRGNESFAEPGGRAAMTYTYDESAPGKLRKSGKMPPKDSSTARLGENSVSSDLWPRSADDPSRGKYPNVGSQVPAGAAKPSVVLTTRVTESSGFYFFMVPQKNPEDGIYCLFSVASTGYQLHECVVGSLARTKAYLDDGMPRHVVFLERPGKPRFGSMAVDFGPMEPAGTTPQRLTPGTVLVMGEHVCAAATYALTCWDTTTGHGAFMYDNDVDLF